MLTYLQRIEWFIGLVLLQVLVLNHMAYQRVCHSFLFYLFYFEVQFGS